MTDLRKLLTDRLLTLENQTKHLREAIVDASKHEPGDEADEAERQIELNNALELLRINQNQLSSVKDILYRMEEGTYDGLCEECGEPIELARLELVPEAKICRECILANRR